MHIKFENGKFVEVEPPAGSEPTKAEKAAAAKPPIKDEDIPSNQRINTNLGEFVEGQVISVMPHQEAEAKRLIANTSGENATPPAKTKAELRADEKAADEAAAKDRDKAKADTEKRNK